MAGGYAAALLDELMGRNRDLNPSEHHKTHWSDPEVCKSYLCAFCPYDLFTNTRSNLGRCDKIHDDEYKESYKKSARFEKMGYEQDFTRYLESLINDIDRKISRGQQRLELNKLPVPVPNSPQAAVRKKRIDYLTERINELVVEAETLGSEGNVDQAQSVMVMCEKLREEKNTLTSMLESELKTETDPNKTMEVCEVCGALLVQADLQLRPRDHYLGKQHTGYARIREYLESRRAQRRGVVGVVGGSNSTSNMQDGLNQEVDGSTFSAPVVVGDSRVEDGEVNSDIEREEPEQDDNRRAGRGDQHRRKNRSRERDATPDRDRKSRRQESPYSSGTADEDKRYSSSSTVRDRSSHYRDSRDYYYKDSSSARDRNRARDQTSNGWESNSRSYYRN